MQQSTIEEMAIERSSKQVSGSDAEKCRSESLSDTCSGSADTDDVCSVCSWTTDQDEQMYGPQRDFGTMDTAASQNVGISLLGNAQDNSSPSNMQHAQGVMPMCFGYAPATYSLPPAAVCYVNVMMPNAELAPQWQDYTMASCEQWSQLGYEDSNNYWGQQRHAHGTWSGDAKSWRFQNRTKGKKTSNFSHSTANARSSTAEATTVILRNLPLECTRDMLLQILDAEGFSGGYDFVHLPIDFQTKVGLGYALVNLVSHQVALSIRQHFEGFVNWPCASESACEVAWNSPHQGLETHIERYRNSPLMHSSVPETYRPVLFVNGFRTAFPAPTSRIRAPRIRHQKPGTSLEAM